MEKTERLFHKSTGLYHDVPGEYVAAHLANGWERAAAPAPPRKAEEAGADAAVKKEKARK
ncbi:MAG: hypothetical protein LBR00_03070 [Clostridiales Family XIII bacterium]|jgi:hypothetical protein|nr:hypothetical protein [Clostridiales Family XIII bacterium]